MYSPLGLFHLAAAITAIVSGAMVFYNFKGNYKHRIIGSVYVVSMLIVIFTALFIYRLTQSINVLHVFALVSFITICKGMLQLAKKRFLKKQISSSWFNSHTQLMAWSYIGLIAALVAETSTRLLMPYLIEIEFQYISWFWGIVGFVTFVVCFTGANLLNKYKNAIEKYRPKKI